MNSWMAAGPANHSSGEVPKERVPGCCEKPAVNAAASAPEKALKS